VQNFVHVMMMMMMMMMMMNLSSNIPTATVQIQMFKASIPIERRNCHLRMDSQHLKAISCRMEET